MNLRQERSNSLRALEQQYTNEQFAEFKKQWIESEYEKRRSVASPGSVTSLTGGFSSPIESLFTLAVIAAYGAAAAVTTMSAPSREQLDKEFMEKIQAGIIDEAAIRAKYKSSFNSFINDLNDKEKDVIINNKDSLKKNMNHYFLRQSFIKHCDNVVKSYQSELPSKVVGENIKAVEKMKESALQLPKISATQHDMNTLRQTVQDQTKILDKNNRTHDAKMFAGFIGLTLAAPFLMPFAFPLVGVAIVLMAEYDKQNRLEKVEAALEKVEKAGRATGVTRFATDREASNLSSHSLFSTNNGNSSQSSLSDTTKIEKNPVSRKT